MKNYLKYILIVALVFFIGAPLLHAEVEDKSYDNQVAGDYLFYCDYDLVTPNYPDFTFPMRAYVYENENSRAFYRGNGTLTEIKNEDGYINLENIGFELWGNLSKIRFSGELFSTAAKEGGYRCPYITTDSQSPSDPLIVDVNLMYGIFNAIDTQKPNKPKSGPIYNPSKQNNIEEEDKFQESSCPESNDKSNDDWAYWYLGDSVKGLPTHVGFKFFVNSKGEKKVKVYFKKSENDILEGEAIFDPEFDTWVTMYYSGNTGYGFKFSHTDYEYIFSNVKDNKFTSCPTKKIGLGRIADDSGSVTNNFLVTFDEELLTQTSTYDPVKLEEGEINDILKEYKYNSVISSKIGVCEDYLGLASTDGTIANLLDDIFGIIKIGSIILVIVLSMIDFSSTVTKSKDELMESVKRLVKRLIVLVIILLLPTFVDMLGSIFGIDNILCGIK